MSSSGEGIKLSNGSVIASPTINSLVGGSSVDVSVISSYSSYNQFKQLTTNQIADLVSQIDGLISTQNQNIISTNSIIATLQATIDDPVSGYQVIYNSTVTAYSTSVLHFIAQESLMNAASNRLSSMYSTLSTVLEEEVEYLSTMNGYSAVYNSYIAQISTNDGFLNAEMAQYDGLSSIMGSYVNDYTTQFSNLQNETDPVAASTLSTTMGNDLIQEGTYNAFIYSSLQTISTMSNLSTIYQTDMNNFTSVTAYDMLKTTVFSTINELLLEQSTLTGAINDYDNQIFWLNQSTIQEFAGLGGAIQSFYTGKLKQIQNQIIQVQYSVKEWESFIGYVISQCMILKLQLYNSIDLLTYQNQQTQDPNKMDLIGKLSTDQTTMQAVVDTLNPLTVTISNIYANISSELLLRSTFIGNRQKMTEIELNVLSSPTLQDSYMTTYTGLQAALGQNASDINASISARVGMIQTRNNSLMTVFNGQWTTNIASLKASSAGPYPTMVFLLPAAIYPIASTDSTNPYFGATEPPFDQSAHQTEFQIPGLDPLVYRV
jgi:hypothetical protein